ncbi:hypothetical protein WN48_08262 [Eufriesea mexicana]|nr:hypothetical protein WN48_08262 [Eufriesea mexicana]
MVVVLKLHVGKDATLGLSFKLHLKRSSIFNVSIKFLQTCNCAFYSALCTKCPSVDKYYIPVRIRVRVSRYTDIGIATRGTVVETVTSRFRESTWI